MAFLDTGPVRQETAWICAVPDRAPVQREDSVESNSFSLVRWRSVHCGPPADTGRRANLLDYRFRYFKKLLLIDFFTFRPRYF